MFLLMGICFTTTFVSFSYVSKTKTEIQKSLILVYVLKINKDIIITIKPGHHQFNREILPRKPLVVKVYMMVEFHHFDHVLDHL